MPLPTATPTLPPSPTPNLTPGPDFTLRLDPKIGGFVRPTHVTQAGEGTGALYVLEQGGLIYRVTSSPTTKSVFLDLTALVFDNQGEMGLLGLAFHPLYNSNGYLYVSYVNLLDQNVVVRYTATADRTQADPQTATPILAIPARSVNHHGGMLAFGPDRYLYYSTGDDGSSGALSQDPTSLWGKVLRIDVDSAQPYAIPPTNPFVNVPGDRGEIWAIGFRNPWRFSFDRASGDLYVADVGEGSYEEIDYQPGGASGGANYGWSRMEGFHCYPEGTACNPDGLTMPAAEYSHALGCAVIGGYVYRGSAYPIMRGLYWYGDLCTGRIWSLAPGSGVRSPTQRARSGLNLTSFGEDEAGELYVVALDTGTLYQLSPAPR